eukprot:GHVS01062534.1.p1 GENE.GHVS01062534.1~~GHVS01062534.1.p1  ORF type:complete len:331 (-),score=6.06 GHVS01062534.1:167-1015(-)
MDEQTSLCDQHRRKAEKFYDETQKELDEFAKQRAKKLPSNVLSDVRSGLERDNAVKKCTFVGSASPFLQLRVKGYYTIACDTKIGAQIPTTPQHVKGFVFEGKRKFETDFMTYYICDTKYMGANFMRRLRYVRVIYYWASQPCELVIQTKFYDEILRSTDIQLRWTSNVLFEAMANRSVYISNIVPDPVIIVAAFCQHQLMTGSGSKKVFAEIISVMFQESNNYVITKTEDELKCAKLQPENVVCNGIQFVFDGVYDRIFHDARKLSLSRQILKEITDHVLK